MSGIRLAVEGGRWKVVTLIFELLLSQVRSFVRSSWELLQVTIAMFQFQPQPAID